MQCRGERYLWAAVNYSASCCSCLHHRKWASSGSIKWPQGLCAPGHHTSWETLWPPSNLVVLPPPLFFFKKHDTFSLTQHLVVGREWYKLDVSEMEGLGRQDGSGHVCVCAHAETCACWGSLTSSPQTLFSFSLPVSSERLRCNMIYVAGEGRITVSPTAQKKSPSSHVGWLQSTWEPSMPPQFSVWGPNLPSIQTFAPLFTCFFRRLMFKPKPLWIINILISKNI